MILFIWTLLPFILFPILWKIKVPYGRHVNRKWGPMWDSRFSWIIMELPALISFMYFFFPKESSSFVNWIFFSCWAGHYLYRSLIFPLKIQEKMMPVIVSSSAFVFNSINGYWNGEYLGRADYAVAWLYDPRFIIGIFLFFLGLIINRRSDRILFQLKDTNHLYQIPQGGLYGYISCPNYFGEIVQWIGFAIMTWSLPGLAFALWTMANLIPRAIQHHQWYKKTFPSYPEKRKAIIPYLL